MRIENMNMNMHTDTDTYDKELIEKMAFSLKIELSGAMIDKFNMFYRMLTEKNKYVNLTAITEYRDVVTKHFEDSLSIVKITKITPEDKIADIGTGAGFPAIPLKIVYPDTEITLVDSLGKRVNFLEEVGEALGFTGYNPIHARSEDLGRDKNYREKFSLTLSRAVASMPVLSEYCLPFVKKGGYFIAYKSGNAEKELREATSAIRKLGGRVDAVEKFVLPDTDMERILISIKKEKCTPEIYPRKAGVPSKMPLK